MQYLKAERLTKIYGEKVLFNEVDLLLNKGQKMAIVAKNGSGKSSLMQILVGLDSSDQLGTVWISREAHLGYLPQAPNFNEELTVLEALFAGDDPTLLLIQAYEKLLLLNELYPDDNQNQVSLNRVMEQLTAQNAWDYEIRIKQILTKFNITNTNQPIRELSGGERKRLAIAALLVREPDLLILDEPTNHLDLDMIEWLENYLQNPNITVLLVTHDRYFLDRVCTEIAELDAGQIRMYRGNYSHYLEKKTELTEIFKTETEKAKQRYKQELAWMRTQPKARGTKAKARVDAFDDIETKARRRLDDAQLNLTGLQMQRLGSKIVEMYHIDKAFDDKILLRDFSYAFAQGDRVGLVGRNGVGKSTLVNLITGTEKPDIGKIVWGKTVVFGHYTQDGIKFTADKKIIDIVTDVAEFLPLAKGKHLTAAQLLDHFQFPYSQHHNYISTLSGGELRRLYLLTILMQNPNFLILDEPTNDLDLQTLHALEDYLQQYEGCLLIVSHDRFFMDKLIEHVFSFEGQGKIRDYPGNYTQYREQRTEEEQQLKLQQQQQTITNTAATVSSGKNASGNNTTRQQQSSSELNTTAKPKLKLSFKEQREFELLETEIQNLETEKSNLEAQLSSGKGSHTELTKWATRINELIALIDEKSMRWLELSEYV
ncbi:MAG: ABC-F family ATP-binding cassette domain-containing protein [Sphingobacteriales bacterium]|jgi:ATP-binding cassette subfamily F protein uup|nr:ABC-F family ATP-binding cassette domain-containing protein [Sphingobacteriales bacterium]MBP9140948.1 ABC-F family ATP-binding cassette domain-containing protein [Chitinophagales bacterium]MDA0198738.1 ABC-F family ATP-binding cassette domain-containing protein [Bacteroidota bacterium]MBK6889360.1 ABC-F family ATP-binding cassette domain-containing protein [Sphingobacteriales bacterium]MBK7528140.1 ABC-F family ATP-binding cassette domain-containing protein [Sphingobacteriales bacterium]